MFITPGIQDEPRSFRKTTGARLFRYLFAGEPGSITAGIGWHESSLYLIRLSRVPEHRPNWDDGGDGYDDATSWEQHRHPPKARAW